MMCHYGHLQPDVLCRLIESYCCSFYEQQIKLQHIGVMGLFYGNIILTVLRKCVYHGIELLEKCIHCHMILIDGY